MDETETFDVRFEDGSEIAMTPEQIRQLLSDMESCVSIISMLAGYRDFAVINIISKHGGALRRAAVFKEKPPYDWKFPKDFPDETAD